MGFYTSDVVLTFAMCDMTDRAPDSLRDDDVRSRMQHLIETWETSHDRRCIFLRCYWHMTDTVLTAIQARQFHDNTWVSTFLHRFADYYFSAVDAYDNARTPVPPVWHQTFDLARSRTTYVLEDLVLGINAHINRDLPYVIYDLLHDRWDQLSTEEQLARRADYDLVNAMIARTTEVVQHDVVERYSHWTHVVCDLCRHGVQIINWEANVFIDGWRQEAWKWGIKMIRTSTGDDLLHIEQELESSVLSRIHLVVSNVEFRERLLAGPSEYLHHVLLPSPVLVCSHYT